MDDSQQQNTNKDQQTQIDNIDVKKDEEKIKKKKEDFLHGKKKNNVGKMYNKKAQFMFGRHPDRWRLDAFGNPVCCQGQFCYTYDHIQPYSKGGKSELKNCVIMQTKLNILKSNKMHINFSDLKNSLKKYSYTEEELDKFEQFIFGDVKRPSMNEYLNHIEQILLFLIISLLQQIVQIKNLKTFQKLQNILNIQLKILKISKTLIEVFFYTIQNSLLYLHLYQSPFIIINLFLYLYFIIQYYFQTFNLLNISLIFLFQKFLLNL